MRQFGLLGRGISYSLSPKMHAALYESMEIKATYELVDGELAEVLSKLRTLDGFNITIPYKQEIMPYLVSVDPAAQRIGAVNTVVADEAGWHGYNTDYHGFRETVKGLIQRDVTSAIILGTGGAAKAVYYALKDMGASKIYVISRHLGATFEGIPCLSYEMLEAGDICSDLLVNCTPVGTNGKKDHQMSPVSEKVVSKQGAVIDLIYNPERTPLLKIAEGMNIPVSNGLKMLVVQAIYAEKFWFPEREVDVQKLYEIIVRAL